MRIGIMASVVAAGVLVGGTALADDVPSGIEVGLRAGYAIPLGDAVGGGGSNNGLSNYLNGAIPIWIDAGYRLASPNLFLGAYFQYGIGLLNTSSTGVGAACGQNGVSCSSNVVMYGIQAHYHFMPDSTFDPWAGLGVGMESANYSASAGGQSGGGSLSGWDYAILQVGGDYHLMPSLGLGPVVMFGLGQYGNASTTVAGNSASQSIPQTAMHEWLTIAIRGVYDISL